MFDFGLDYYSVVFFYQGIGFFEQKYNQEGYLISIFLYNFIVNLFLFGNEILV